MARKKGGSQADPRWRSHIEPAPDDLRIVQAFVNTDERGHPGESFSDPRALADWFERWGLLSRGQELTTADFEQSLAIRVALRAMIHANHGPPPPSELMARLDRMAAAAPARVRITSDGGAHLEPTERGLGEALARLFAIVAHAQLQGHWQHLKLCAREDCDAAFYDFSSSHSAKWCSRRCGNKGSSRTHRVRSQRDRERRRKERLLATRSNAVS